MIRPANPKKKQRKPNLQVKAPQRTRKRRRRRRLRQPRSQSRQRLGTKKNSPKRRGKLPSKLLYKREALYRKR
jgi:hypothetical protein